MTTQSQIDENLETNFIGNNLDEIEIDLEPHDADIPELEGLSEEAPVVAKQKPMTAEEVVSQKLAKLEGLRKNLLMEKAADNDLGVMIAQDRLADEVDEILSSDSTAAAQLKTLKKASDAETLDRWLSHQGYVQAREIVRNQEEQFGFEF